MGDPHSVHLFMAFEVKPWRIVCVNVCFYEVPEFLVGEVTCEPQDAGLGVGWKRCGF